MPFDSTHYLSEISSGLRSRAAIQAVDFLTDADVEELRGFLLGPDRSTRLGAEEVAADQERAGRVRLLIDQGLLEGASMLDGSITVFGCNPKAAWAVGRHDAAKERAEADRKERERQRKADKVWSVATTIIGAVVGWLLAQAGNIISLAAASLPS